jgi:hypothetical protein
LVACFFSLLASLVVVNACSSDVELYADYKDVAIIYAMLDHRSDTNYVKITRAFCGTNDDPIDASKVALIYDSSNYPGKLDTRIIELRSTYGGSYESTGREIILDTMTIRNKEEGVFYAPDQMVYYTTEPLNSGTNGQKYKYYTSVQLEYGDTLWKVADRYMDSEFYNHISYIEEVKSINHIHDENEVMAGKMLIIPYYSTDYIAN